MHGQELTQPAGVPLATVEVSVPPGHVGLTAAAALQSNGRVVALGEAQVTADNQARIILRASELAARRGHDDYGLWITLNRKPHPSWYPGFGDLFLRDVWHFQQGPWKRVGDVSLWQEKKLSAPENRLRIHYHRYGGYQEGVSLWTWNDYSELPPVEIFPVDEDGFGLLFELDTAAYGSEVGPLRLGLLPRIGGDWNLKEDDNKFWDASLGREIYLIGTASAIWTEKPDTRQQVLAAHIDNLHCIAVELSRPVDPGELAAEAAVLMDDEGQRLKVRHLLVGDRPSNQIKLKTVEALDVGRRSYSVSLPGFDGTAWASLRDVLDEPAAFHAASATLGAVYSPHSTTFRLFAPTAQAVAALLYDTAAEDARPCQTVAMRKAGQGIFEGTAPGDLEGKFYRYRLEGPGYPPGLEVLDPYCVNVAGAGKYGRITDLAAANPPDWARYRHGPRLESPVDMVVYELHVRDFSIADNAGIGHKGRYLAFTETGTHLPGHPAIKTGLDHLQELGVTHVQLLPVQCFNADGEGYDWGYMTLAFNSPEGWYASHRDDDSKIREFKQLVAALHARGIGVILDVVYNHTAHGAPFGAIHPEYHYRFLGKGQYANGSGVGNDFRSEAPMVRKFIIDSLKHWVSEYGVDGFRFDLMALIDSETMREAERQLRQLKPDIVLYGEPWSSGFSPIKGQPTDKAAIRATGIGAFNDHFRNALGGSPNGAEAGFLQDGSRRDQLVLGLEGSHRDWASHPAQSINYMTCHDNLVLSDKLRWFNPAASERHVIDTMKLGYLLLFTAQGVPFLHGGEDFARSKYGHGNSYDAGDEINRIDWSLKARNLDLFTYTRDLIRLRKAHPLFRLRSAEAIAERLRFHLPPTDKSLAYSVDGRGLENEDWLEACVLANGEEATDVEFTLPPGRWQVALAYEGLAGEAGWVEHRLLVRRKSGLVLCRPEETRMEDPPPELAPEEDAGP